MTEAVNDPQGATLPAGESDRQGTYPDGEESTVVLVAVSEDPAAPDVLTVVAYLADDLDLVEKQFPGQGDEPQIVNPRVLSMADQIHVLDLLLTDNPRCCPEGRYGICVGRFSKQGGWWDPASLRAFKVLAEPSQDELGGDDGIG